MVTVDVDLVINCYERTYRDLLRPGRFRGIEVHNRFTFTERWCLINNVEDREDARRRADGLVDSGELTGYRFVADHIADALRVTGLPHRVLRHRPYFLDYGLVMTTTGSSRYLLGWDAETSLQAPIDWVTPATKLLEEDQTVFSASPSWPAATLAEETVESNGHWALNYGFSDQAFLVRRSDLARPIWRRFAPAAVLRHREHPRTFEARLEAYQRVSRRTRATSTLAVYETNFRGLVLDQLGDRSRFESARVKVLTALWWRWPRGARSPRLRLP